MWFLEIYFKASWGELEQMRYYNSYGELAIAQAALHDIWGKKIHKFISYYSDGQTVTNELTINP